MPWKITHDGDEVVAGTESGHNHIPDPAELEIRTSMTRIRQRASTSRDTPRLIIQESQSRMSEEAVVACPQYHSIQRMIQRKRKLNGEPVANPGSITDIDIPDLLKVTLRGDQFLLHDSGSDDPARFFIFD